MAKSPESLKNLVPGNRRGPAKTTKLLKDAILQAANNAHPDGMVGYLTQQAQENPGPFMSLLGKVLPTQLAQDPDNPLPGAIMVHFVKPEP